jgi:flagellin
MSVINTNVSALVAQSSLRSNSLKLSTAMERLSTGSKINSAKDDAAGQAISERMTSKIRGYAVAVRNANDGVSLAQTAEGDLNQIASNLQRIRELAVQSSNGANTQSDRDALNNESNSLVAEIDRIAQASSFNGSKLLDGAFVSKVFQVGAGNVAAQDQISVSIGSARTSNLGVTSQASVTGTVGAPAALAAGNLLINATAIRAATAADDTISTTGVAGTSGISKAAAINASSSITGVTATVGATTKAGASVTEAALTGSISINGFATASITTTGVAAADKVIVKNAINALTAKTGVVATDSDPSGLTGLTLTAADGRNIDVELTTLTSAETGVSAGSARSAVTLTSTNAITVAGVTPENAGLTAGTTASAATGVSISTITLGTDAGARQAMDSVDAAITTINTSRASLGATQNRFLAAVNNLETASTNLSASRSRIMDTDYAAETTNLAKAQIISQAATAMLAQANQSQQSVLSLLK